MQSDVLVKHLLDLSSFGRIFRCEDKSEICRVAMEDINQQDDEERVLNVSDDDKEGI